MNIMQTTEGNINKDQLNIIQISLRQKMKTNI